MTSEIKEQANRENAKLSTGPRSAYGKAVSSRNAVRHGLLSPSPTLPFFEKDRDWRIYRAGILQSLQPVGLFEMELVERVALLGWRLRRVVRLEKELAAFSYRKNTGSTLISSAHSQPERNSKLHDFWTNVKPEERDVIRRFLEAARSGEQGKEAEERRLQEVRFLRSARPREVAGAWSEALEKIVRYEAHLERCLFRTVHELERRQALRQGRTVGVPVAVDVALGIS